MPPPDTVEELSADIAGQKVTLKNAPINTIVTLATFLLCSLIAYAFYQHQQEAKEASVAFVSAIKEQTITLKEQTVVGREANCLMRFEMRERQNQAEFCKTIAR